MNAKPVPDMQYQQIEAALAGLYRIEEEDMGAFRARLRHLRNLGIPDLPKVGRGSKVAYTRNHLWELFIALALVRGGMMPSVAARMIINERERIPKWQALVDKRGQSPYVLAVITSCFGGKSGENIRGRLGFFPLDEFDRNLNHFENKDAEKWFDTLTVVNLIGLEIIEAELR